jgi:ornithine cyclodeaminase/alanine dehydrogenase
MRFFSESQVRQSLNPNEVIAAIRNAFARDFHSTLQMPVRTQVELGGSLLLLMPCHDSALQAAGVKTVMVSSRSGVNAVYMLLDPVSGEVLATMEANYLTDLRTAVTSAVATDFLAVKDAATLAIFGAGRQAAAHVAVLPLVRNFSRILVCGSGRSDVSGFCRDRQAHGIEITPASAERCAREADVICTCTTATEPLLDGRWLRPGVHLNLVGAFQPHTREVDSETMRRSRIVVDTYEGALAEAGDLLIPLKQGIMERSAIVADLHEIASGAVRGRTSEEEITVFKSVGCALEDLAVAQLVWKNQMRSDAPDNVTEPAGWRQ